MARTPPQDSAPRVSAGEARRLLLGAQGLLDAPERATAESVYQLVLRLGYVQIDSINVVERAHHLILAPRSRGYRPSLLHGLLERQRRLFEHWTHDAAAIPTIWFPFWHYRFDRGRRELPRRPWWSARMGGEPEAVIARVRARLERAGPLLARDVAEPAGRAGPAAPQEPAAKGAAATGPATATSWWGWSPPKTALARLGVATAQEIAAFWQAVPAAAVRTWCADAAARGEIAGVMVESADGSPPRAAFAVADWRERAQAEPAARPRLRLLCPFDPVLHDRRRALRLFRFDFRFEAFVPAAQRRHGYYVMPMLEGDRLVGRIDPKLHRDEGRLEVRSVRWEPGVRPTRRRRAALEAAVGRLAGLVGAGRCELPARL